MTRHTRKVERKAPVAPRGVIAAASRELGCTREHLSRVLHGHRASRSLTRRYHAYLAGRTQEAA